MKYFGGFSERKDLSSFIGYDATLPDDFPTDDEILFAAYGGDSYDGCAFVLFQRGGTLFEVNGSHCSCYGLEGQWCPEITTWLALSMRPVLGYGYGQDEENALAALIAKHVDGGNA